MSIYQYEWGQINVLQPNIAEIIINTGWHFTKALQEKILDLLDHFMPGHYSILFNRVNCYTFDNDLMHLNAVHNVDFVAVLLHNQACVFLIKNYLAQPNSVNCIFKVFKTRKNALDYIINGYAYFLINKPVLIKKLA